MDLNIVIPVFILMLLAIVILISALHKEHMYSDELLKITVLLALTTQQPTKKEN